MQTRAATDEEITKVVRQISPLKTPGLDGVHDIFYKNCWSIINKNFCRMSRAFLKHGRFLPDLNRTNITLIPKKNNPEKVNDYRHISFYNVSYKFISK